MPYSNPSLDVPLPPVRSNTTSPLPVRSQGRPGHRRSFSYNPEPSSRSHLNGNGNATPTAGAFAPLGALPHRKPASFHLADDDDDDDDSSPEEGDRDLNQTNDGHGPSQPTTNGQNGTLQQRSHSRTSSLPAPPPGARFAGANLKPTPVGKPSNLTTDDEDDGRGLPPLKLRIPGLLGSGIGSPSGRASPGLVGSGMGSPRASAYSSPRGSSTNLAALAGGGGSGAAGLGLGSPRGAVPFPKSESPPRSRTSSNVELVVSPPTPHSNGTQQQQQQQQEQDSTNGTTKPKPSFSRTASNPSISPDGRIILASGKPLKSSLKGSASSPHIPFPAQSVLPSRIYADIAQAQQRERSESMQGHLGGGAQGEGAGAGALMVNQRHTRAASAPNLPNFELAALQHQRGGFDGQDTSFLDDTSASYEGQGGEDDHDQDHDIYPGASTAPATPKAVHFPSSISDLTTIKFYKRSAKPQNLLLSGASEGETETETDGEGYASGGNGGAGYHYGINNTWGFGSGAGQRGYQNPWDRYTTSRGGGYSGGYGGQPQGQGQGGYGAQGQSQQGQGYPFPKIQMGGSGRMVVPTRQSAYPVRVQSGGIVRSTPAGAGSGSGLGLNLNGNGPNGTLPNGAGKKAQAQGALLAAPQPQPAALAQQAQLLAHVSAHQQQQQQQQQKATTHKVKKRILYDLDYARTSTMPKRDLAMFDNVFLESVRVRCEKKNQKVGAGGLSGVQEEKGGGETESSEDDDIDGEESGGSRVSPDLVCTLQGTLLVRNLAYEKRVSVRFTLDDWHTTSEVSASYSESLGSLPAKWRSWVLGDRSSSTPSSPTDPTSSSKLESPPPGPTPQWDRFTFTINLSDYARSRSLSSRTLWLVVRYAIPGDVRVPVARLMPGFDFRSLDYTSTAGGDKQDQWTSELLGRCERDMVDLLVQGLGPSSSSSSSLLLSPTAATGGNKLSFSSLSVRQSVDQELRKRQIGVGAGLGSEWWDNNASGNYRIGFREREVVTVKPLPLPVSVGGEDGNVEKESGENVKGEGEKMGVEAEAGEAQGDLPRRKTVLSCPPMFTNAPPPQVTPGSLVEMAYEGHQRSSSSSGTYGSYPTRSVSGNGVPNPASLPLSNSSNNLGSLATGAPPLSLNAMSTARRAETTKAMAETTLERLKRLNLRNYAAPGMSVSVVTGAGVGRTSSNPLPLGSMPASGGGGGGHSKESTTSSENGDGTNDSTPLTSPLHTPTLGAVDIPLVKDGVRVGTGSEEASPSGDSSAGWRAAAAIAEVSKEKANVNVKEPAMEEVVNEGLKQSEKEKEDGDGRLRPLLTRNGTVVPAPPPPAAGVNPGGESDGTSTPTTATAAIPPSSIAIPPASSSIAIPGRGGAGADLPSPLLEPLMSGGVGASSGGFAGGMELGTSPPFSSLADAAEAAMSTRFGGGRTLSSTNLSLNLLPDFGAPPPPVSNSAASLPVSVSDDDDKTQPATVRAPAPSVLPPNPPPLTFSHLGLKPKQIGILEGIREKSTSSPPRSPGGSGRNSPVPFAVAAMGMQRTFSGSHLADASNVVVNRVDGITGSVKPPPPSSTAALSRSSTTTTATTAAGEMEMMATPKPALPRRVHAHHGVRHGATSPGASGGSGSESNASNASNGSKSGSGSGGSKSGSGSGSGRMKRSSVPAGNRTVRSPVPRGGLGLVFQQQQQQQGGGGGAMSPTSLSASFGVPGMPGGSGTMSPPAVMSPSSTSPGAAGDDIRDPDSIYQAFVRQWCFASAPSPAQAGGFGRKEV